MKIKMKLLEIPSCNFCRFMTNYINGPRCSWPDKLPLRNLNMYYIIPDWCPLPDVKGNDKDESK